MAPARSPGALFCGHGFTGRRSPWLLRASAGRREYPRVTPFYVAGFCLVVAQILGIYALVSRKADFTFAIIMLLLVVVALGSGADGVYRQLH